MKRLYLRSSVAAGHPSRKGDGLEKRLLQAAEGGDAGAQCNLGILYGNGLDDNGRAPADRVRVVSASGDALARHPSAQSSIRIRASSLALDPGANRRGKALCARVEAKAADTSC